MTLLPQDIRFLCRLSECSGGLGIGLRLGKVLQRFQDRSPGCEVFPARIVRPFLEQHSCRLHRVVDVEPRPACLDRNRHVPPITLHVGTPHANAIQRGAGWRVAA